MSTAEPYQAGTQIDFQVIQSHSPGHLSPSQWVTATIRKVLSMTMSPVLDVTIPTRHGPSDHCVLKLYDRRFGTSLRSGYADELVPYTQANDEAFRTFVRRGIMPAFLGQLNEANESEDLLPPVPRQFLDNSPEGRAKYEAALWRECNEHFRCETEAYMRLSDLQGKSLPRMLAHIRLVAVGGKPISTPADIPSKAASYFEVKGILLERIDGYNLEDITTSPVAPPASDLKRWRQIIQSAVDLVHEVNRRGVILEDCAPRNVVVDKKSQTPRIVDLAQCRFKQELVKAWRRWKWDEYDDWDPDVEYWKRVDEEDNTGAIGAVMVHLVERETGVKLEIKYPDCSSIISGIQRRKAEAVECRGAPLKSR
ncbi:hypothetical protein VTI74DRAFT_232 [Chaetomium olivicolor]